MKVTIDDKDFFYGRIRWSPHDPMIINFMLENGTHKVQVETVNGDKEEKTTKDVLFQGEHHLWIVYWGQAEHLKPGEKPPPLVIDDRKGPPFEVY